MARRPGGLAPFKSRNFSLFWGGYFVSNTGRWIELTGAVWIVSDMTGSPVLIGLLGLARAVPGIILSPIAGVFADRVDQRRMLFTTQLVSMLASFALGALILSGNVQLWQIYVQVAIQSAVSAFDTSVRQALFPRLVPREHLGDAVTLHSTATETSQLIGPAIGGLLIAGWGNAAPFLVNGFTYLILMAAVVAMSGIVPRAARAGSTVRTELAEGMRHLWGSPLLSGLLRLELVFGLLQINPEMITIIARDVLHVGPAGLGILLSAPAAGSVLGVFALLGVGQVRRQGRLIVFSQLLYAMTLVAIAVTATFAVVAGSLVLAGFFESLSTVTRHNVMQLEAPGHMRGRIMANMGMITRGTSPLAQTQSGILAALFGPALAVLTAAAALAVSASIQVRRNRHIWAYERVAGTRPPEASTSPSPAGSTSEP